MLQNSIHSVRVEISYRVFVRQVEDISGQFDRVINIIESTWIGQTHIVEYSELTDSYWRVRPEEIDKVKEKGLLVTEYHGDMCLVIRELQITVTPGEDMTSKDVVSILSHFFKNEFTSIKIVEEILSGFQAL